MSSGRPWTPPLICPSTRLTGNNNMVGDRSYGRVEVLSGYVNAVFLVLVAALIVVESVER